MSEKVSMNGDKLDYTKTMMSGFSTLLEMQRPMLNAMADFNSRIFENASSFNKEWVNFLNRRLEADLAMPRQLAACKSPQDVYDVYNEFYQRAFTHYQAEFEEFSKISRTMSDETLSSMKDSMEDLKRRAHAA